MASLRLPRLVTPVILVLGLLASGQANAQNTYFNGFTNGLWCSTASVGCVNPNTNLYQTAVLIQNITPTKTVNLRYTNSVFSGTVPNGGTITFNNPASMPWGSTQNVNNFGAFYISGGTVTWSSPFSLWVTFIDPVTTTLTYAAMVTGTITSGAGGVNIAFNPNSQNITWASGNGWATITVNDFGAPAEQGTSVTGMITAQVTPEPVTLSLLGTGLIGLVGFARRRRRTPSA